jgi:iron(II)-dependent oxidoreductase
MIYKESARGVHIVLTLALLLCFSDCAEINRLAALQNYDCESQLGGGKCQERRGPNAGESSAHWQAQYKEWRAKGRAAFDFGAYDNPDVAWARTSYVQPQAMLHDRFLYDRTADGGVGKWTVDRYLEDVNDRYGGIDSILLWQFYPNAGVDDRNNFDFIDSLPGGMAKVKEMVNTFHARGVKVLWPYFPWDTGTRNTGKPQYVAQVEKVIATDADGFNGDTVAGVNASFWDEAVKQGKGLAIEPEVMMDSKAMRTGLQTNVMSWGYWRYTATPAVDAFKSLDARHMTHICERWATDRTDGLHHFFFNGIGYESWENVWAVFNKLTPMHAEMLRRMATILRGTNGITSRGVWAPHVPYALHENVFVSEFSLSAPPWGGHAPLAFSCVNRFCMALLYGRAGRLTAKKRWFPARAVGPPKTACTRS